LTEWGYPATLPYGCTGKNINATFLRGTGVEAENVCNTPPPALKGVYSADFGFNLDSINLAGGSPNGTWKLKVYDSQAGEIGYVLGWKMYFDQQPPNASFTTNAIGLFVSLNAASTLNGNATYIWDFGDGDSAVGQSVIHQYPVRGQFTIRLLVIDACGIDSAKATYSLEPPPCFAEFPSTTTPTAITDNNPGGDTLVINTNQVIGSKLGKDVQLRKVCIQGTHPRVGDLKMKLISPGGIEILLIDRTYYPFQQPYGCLNSDFNFCIIHGDSNDGEFKCDATGAAIKGEFTAMTPQDLRQVNDLVTNPNGAWKLVVYDMGCRPNRCGYQLEFII
jgi:subtilisin-like proprotein convertase family protein